MPRAATLSLGLSLNPSSQLGCHLINDIGLDHVTRLKIAEIFHADAALVPLLHLAHVILEAAQRAEPALVDHDMIADHAHPGARARNRSLQHVTARNHPYFGNR